MAARFEVEESSQGFIWVCQTSGGAYFRAAKPEATEKAALDAGHAWLRSKRATG
jgi:hypothetical protein